MALPFFYIDEYNTGQSSITLNEDNSRHVVQVLRMKVGEHINLTDGKGNLITTEIVNDNKKACEVKLSSVVNRQSTEKKVSIAISLIKNASRFEWFLEKATELGVAEIIPLICERTERQKFRYDRMLGICKSAMLQSMQTWLPELHEPVPLNEVVTTAEHKQKMIAHCAADAKVEFSSLYTPSFGSHIILIGPEGDFSDKEIEKSRECDFIPVSLGATRLRTETAGIFAASWANGANER